VEKLPHWDSEADAYHIESDLLVVHAELLLKAPRLWIENLQSTPTCNVIFIDQRLFSIVIFINQRLFSISNHQQCLQSRTCVQPSLPTSALHNKH
jgi:hypothetical protein